MITSYYNYIVICIQNVKIKDSFLIHVYYSFIFINDDKTLFEFENIII